MRRRTAVLLTSALVILGAGCAGVGESPDVPVGADGTVDQVLVTGRDIFSARCASCHGAEGEGSRGPRISADRVVERYPDAADQAAFISDGRGGMPAFGGTLDEAEIDAVVRYTREVL